MIEFETLHHVSIPVTDLDRARQFYGEVLGLPETERPAFDFAGAWYALGGRQLHLIVHPGTRSLRGTTVMPRAAPEPHILASDLCHRPRRKCDRAELPKPGLVGIIQLTVQKALI